MGSRNTVIFLGNSIFGDDRIGLIVGGILREKLEGLGFDVQIVERTGFALLDCLTGYDSAVVVDSVCTGKNSVGEVLPFAAKDFKLVTTGAPHLSGIPEAVQLMKGLRIDLPDVSILGINVSDPYTLSEDVSEDLKRMQDTISNEILSKILALPEGR